MIKTLTDFLLARIAEDEGRAKEAGGEIWDAYYLNGVMTRDDPKWIIDSAKTLVSYEVVNGEFAQHIGQWHPARVLAECEARRQVVEACANIIPVSQWLNSSTLHWVAMALALPYADHPDYRDEWKP